MAYSSNCCTTVTPPEMDASTEEGAPAATASAYRAASKA